MNQMQLRRERDVVFIALEKKSRNGVTVKDLMESNSELFNNTTNTRDYIRNLRNRCDSVQVRIHHSITHYHIAPNLYDMFHFKREKRV